jgi:2-(1,2-epoxy-1,2-dihydrophenyl)acetyl-CoA isomerase
MPEIVVSRGEIATVRLNRPDRGNSVTPDITEQLQVEIASLLDDADVRGIVLTGTGKVFCAGADVKAQFEMYREQGLDAVIDYLVDPWMPSVQRTIRALRTAHVPVVAAVNGAAAAGGCDFALACDARVASSRARMTESYINLGMVPVGGGAHLLTALAGPALARRMILTGSVLSAQESLAAGLVDEVVDHDDLLDRAASVAADLAAAPRESVRAARELVRLGDQAAWEAALDASYEANVRLLREPAVQERLRGVLERFGDRAGA